MGDNQGPDNFFVSRTLKFIDASTGFNKERFRSAMELLKERDIKKIKLFEKNSLNNLKMIKREEHNRRKSNNSAYFFNQLNILSSPYKLKFLSNISPYIKKVNNSLIIEKKEAEDNGSDGFNYIWNQPSILKLTNEIRGIDDKKDKNSLYEKYNENEPHSIFTNTHRKIIKESLQYKEIREKFQRILNRNMKVKSLIEKIKPKVKYDQNYNPRFDAIEKHQPFVFLDSKTKRTFPDSFLKNKSYTYSAKNSFPLIYANKSVEKKSNKNAYICSGFSLKNLFFTKYVKNELESPKKKFPKYVFKGKNSSFNEALISNDIKRSKSI